MIHESCKKRKRHVWSLWEPHVDQLGALKRAPYLYRRECTTMGCDIVQFTETLVSLEEPEEIDTGATDKALAEYDALKKKEEPKT